MSTTNIIVLKSSDGPTFRIEAAVARQSQLLANKIDNKCANEEIQIANVTSKILELVVEYCKKHHVDEANLSSDEDLKKWDQQFMQTDQSTIYELMIAANYLDIKSLLDLACQTAAEMLKDKTPEEIRSMFNIKNDFTPEEEEAVRKENQWAWDEQRVQPSPYRTLMLPKEPATSRDNEP